MIDGNFAGDWGSNNGSSDGSDYITIDLGQPRFVASIYIVNRDDEFVSGELRILANTVWLNLEDNMSLATQCGNPVGTGTLHCTTPMDAQFVYIMSGVGNGNVVNYREIMAFPAEQRTQNAQITKWVPSITDPGEYFASGLLEHYNSRTTAYGKVSFDSNGDQRTV